MCTFTADIADLCLQYRINKHISDVKVIFNITFDSVSCIITKYIKNVFTLEKSMYLYINK